MLGMMLNKQKTFIIWFNGFVRVQILHHAYWVQIPHPIVQILHPATSCTVQIPP